MICTTHQCLVSQEDCQDHSIARAFSLHITQKLNKKEKLSEVIRVALTLSVLRLLLNNRYSTKFKAFPILVPPRGYLIRLMVLNTPALLLLR